MSHINRETVEKIAQLAQLKLTDGELDYYQSQFERILSYMDILQSQDDSLPSDWRNELQFSPTPERSDQAIPSNVIEKVLVAAPKVVGTTFQVPRIIE